MSIFSAILLLRIPDADAKREAYAAFVADLKQAFDLATSLRSAQSAG